MTISGSLPKGLPTNFYYQMLEICNNNGIPVIIDSSGKSLKTPWCIKKNHLPSNQIKAELSQLLGINMEMGIIDLKQALNHELFTGLSGLSCHWVVKVPLSGMVRTITKLRFQNRSGQSG